MLLGRTGESRIDPRYLGFAPFLGEVCMSRARGWACPLLSLPLMVASGRLSLLQPHSPVACPVKMGLARGHLTSVNAWQARVCVCVCVAADLCTCTHTTRTHLSRWKRRDTVKTSARC